ncbi:SNF2-rel-dom domain-containing protein [Fusarium keratoplasticum]|nr:SNF2-rel-dom domain-containing protein [Fusarium keratoplasticum]
MFMTHPTLWQTISASKSTIFLQSPTARVPNNPEEIQPWKDAEENLSVMPTMFQTMRSFPKRFAPSISTQSSAMNIPGASITETGLVYLWFIRNKSDVEIEDLQEICGAVGIPDWEDLSMNEHQPLRTLELSQVIDAFAVHQKLNSAPHCALLANECGSGKTNTLMVGIEMSVRIR